MMGVVDFFGDTTYSGGASMNGPFMASLGAGAAAVSIAGGASEFLNYVTRGLSGWFVDRTSPASFRRIVATSPSACSSRATAAAGCLAAWSRGFSTTGRAWRSSCSRSPPSWSPFRSS